MRVATSNLFSQLLSCLDRHFFARAVRETFSETGGKVLIDSVGCFNLFQAGQKIKGRYRRVVIWLEDKQKEMVLPTNRLDLSAETIAEIYRQRWQIELFFKAIKQNLRIKTFVGTSANAVRIQIWTALIAMLLLKLLQFRSKIGWSLSNLVALLS